MKKIYLLTCCLIVAIHCIAQDTVLVDGLLINRYLKSEVEFQFKNNALKKQGKSYSQMIDIKKDSYFFTKTINRNINLIKDEKELASIICSTHNYQNIELYDFPPYNEYLLKYFVDESIIETIDFPQNCQYYVCEQDSKYVYQIYHICGNAIRIQYNYDYLDPDRHFKLFRYNSKYSFFDINNNISTFYIYLFYKCDYIYSNSKVDGFKEWR